jgi:methanogen extracellular protein (TIGR04279 family)
MTLAAGWSPAVQVQIDSPGLTEIVGFADHINDLNTGNWVVLTGGTTVSLPTLTAEYSGVSSSSYTKAGNTVTLTSTFTSKTVTYPLATHPIYRTGDTITANFKGENILSGGAVEFRLVGGSVEDWKQAYSDLLTNADMTKLRTLLGAPVVPPTSADPTFDINGDAAATYVAPAAGDYMLVVLREMNIPGTYVVAIYGMTPVEVIDWPLVTSAPTSVNVGDSFAVTFSLTGAGASPDSYRYGAVIISQSAYDLVARLQTTGELSATDLLLNGVLVAEGTGTIAGTPAINLVGFTLNSIDVDVVTTKTSQIFGSSNIAIGFSNPTTNPTGSVTITTGSGMPTGTYVLLMGVWEQGGNKLVGVKTSTIILNSPPAPPPTNSAPVAVISGPATTVEGDSVTFSGAGSYDTDGTIIGYFWNFGDGSTGVGASASHTYTTPGTYTVTLRVTDNNSAEGTATSTIVVNANHAPTCTISTSDGKINEAISFSGAGMDIDGTIASYSWNFGDGSSGSGASTAHTYTVEGTYTVTLTVTDNKGKTGTATASVRVYPPSPTLEEIEDDTPQEAAAKLENTLPSDAAVILQELPPQSAAQIVEDLKPATAASIIVKTNATSAAQIVEKIPPTTAAAIVESAVTGNNTQAISNVLLTMNDQDAAKVLVEVNSQQAAVVIESMATQNLNEAAKTVEDAVKLFINELDPTTKAEVKKKVKETLENCTVESLVQLFIEIANLPNTPSTVAAVFETMELSKTLQVITGIGEQGAWSELGMIFSYLTQSTLGTIYTAMPAAQRAQVSPYISAQTLALLPKIGMYQVSAMSITPASVAAGATVTITVNVANVGVEAGTHDVVLKINGVVEETKTVALNAGTSTNVSFTVSKSAVGSYSATVESQSGTFAVTQANPAAFTVSNLQISKTTASAGESLTVTVTVANTGGASGTYTLSVKLDGVEKYSDAVTLDAGKSVTKTYTVSSTSEGAHTVAVDGSSVQFTVTAAPPATTDYTWYIAGGVLVIVVAVAVYFFFIKKK